MNNQKFPKHKWPKNSDHMIRLIGDKDYKATEKERSYYFINPMQIATFAATVKLVYAPMADPNWKPIYTVNVYLSTGETMYLSGITPDEFSREYERAMEILGTKVSFAKKLGVAQ